MEITLVLTHNCNLRCTYCYSGTKKNVDMKKDTAFKAIDFAFENFPDTKKTLSFFGGEPLMKWDLLKDAAEYLYSKADTDKVLTSVTINGTMLTRDKFEWLTLHNFRIGLSIDSNQKSHDILRKMQNRESSFSKCLPALKDFIELKAKADIISVVDPGNIKYIFKGIKWLHDFGIKRISLNPNFYTEWTVKDLGLFKKFYKKLSVFYSQAE